MQRIEDNQERSFVIITTDAEKDLKKIHNRTPLVINKENFLFWLGNDYEKACNILKPMNANEYTFHPVSPKVGKISNDNISVTEKYHEKESQLNLFLTLFFGFSGPAIADSEVFKIDVSAESYRNYILSGIDRNGSVSGEDPTVTVKKGDTIIFDVDASRHPFYIKTKFSRGGGDQVTTGIISGTPGTQNGKISWNTKGVSSGKYYYVCSPHASFGMGGTIIIE